MYSKVPIIWVERYQEYFGILKTCIVQNYTNRYNEKNLFHLPNKHLNGTVYKMLQKSVAFELWNASAWKQTSVFLVNLIKKQQTANHKKTCNMRSLGTRFEILILIQYIRQLKHLTVIWHCKWFKQVPAMNW